MKSPKSPRASYTSFPHYDRIHGPRPGPTPAAKPAPTWASAKLAPSASPALVPLAVLGQTSRRAEPSLGLCGVLSAPKFVAVLGALRGSHRPVQRTLQRVLVKAQKAQAKADNRLAATGQPGVGLDVGGVG